MTASPVQEPVQVPVLDGIAEWSSRYEVILCDIWGVLHDGLHAHRAAADALNRFRQRGGTVVLVSNAPRPAASVVPHLDHLGVPRDAWDGIVTSGDVTRAVLEGEDAPYFWLGPERDFPLFEGLAAPRVEFEAARTLVCTGLLHDERETPEDYRDLLGRARERGMRFVCANPDLVVERGGELVYCAGALAEAYAELGGEVVFAGKPHRPIYESALAIAASLRKRETELARVLAVGDALRTDVAGAEGLGCDSLFVARGIHTHEIGIAALALDHGLLSAFLSAAEVHPTAAIDKLAW